MLTSGDPSAVHATTSDAVDALGQSGYLDTDEVASLSNSFRLLQSLQQITRVAVGSEAAPHTFSRGLRDRMALAADCPGFDVLEHRYEEVRKTVSDMRCRKIGSLATES
jgi:glutamate-ammonia-ligase adenylyltransferase